MASKQKSKTDKKSAPQKSEYELDREGQVTKLEDFLWDNVIFSNVLEKTHEKGTFRRVYLNYQYPGTKKMGPILVQPGRYYCFGVQPNNVDKDGNILLEVNGTPKPVSGYQVAFKLESKDGPTEQEATFVKFITKFVKKVRKYVVENRVQLKLGKKKPDDQIMEMVKEIAFYKRTKDDPEDPDAIDTSVPPTLYAKLNYYNGKFQTNFYGPGDKLVNPMDLIKKPFHIEPTIQFNNLYITEKTISVQFSVYDAVVIPVSFGGPTKRMAPVNSTEGSSADFKEAPRENDDEEEVSLQESEED